MNITSLRDSWSDAVHASRKRARTDPENENYWEGRLAAYLTGIEALDQHLARPRQALTDLQEAVNDAIASNPKDRAEADYVSACAHQLHDLVGELSAALD